MFEQLPLFEIEAVFDATACALWFCSVCMVSWTGEKIEIDCVLANASEYVRGDYAHWLAMYGA